MNNNSRVAGTAQINRVTGDEALEGLVFFAQGSAIYATYADERKR